MGLVVSSVGVLDCPVVVTVTEVGTQGVTFLWEEMMRV